MRKTPKMGVDIDKLPGENQGEPGNSPPKTRNLSDERLSMNCEDWHRSAKDYCQSTVVGRLKVNMNDSR
jgi:hypothetical protein